MALLQTDHDNAHWLTGSPARLTAHRLAHLGHDLIAPLQSALEAVRQWSIRRQVRAWRTMRERAQQRRELAALSDRELKDIGITRYEIEFVLRQARWR